MKKFIKLISTMRLELTDSMDQYGSKLAKLYTHL
ncbi:hypothetical protein J2S10_002563 [Neobacillus ginsengisoli]|uniref:Uncharacterized protein n=1 Tax=Neobacillus ginsengisoli TaxID=904295 RepID=A0ABT9XVM7_9BACI|nr:hypothetical protein [Neobacillus ginsengisoli]